MHKLIRKDETQTRKVNDQKIAYAYIDKNLNPNISIARVEGNDYKGEIVPEQTYFYYLLEGQITLKFEDETINLETGDCVMIDKGETYFMEGTFKVLTICNPAFESK